MCGRYRRTTSEEELARIYHIPIPKETDLPISYNIAPSQKALTIRFNPETRERSLDAPAMGIDSILGERFKDCLPEHQCAS
jgi:putative SOS response-associated peptidase YedK